MGISAIGTCRNIRTGPTRGSTVLPDSASSVAAESVTISRGRHLGDMMASFLAGAGKDGVITMDELQSFRDARLQEAGQRLMQALAALGISPDAPLGVSVAADGTVTVKGKLSAPDRERVRKALSADKDFLLSFNAASGVASLMGAAEVSEKFTGMYAQNAKEAVAAYSSLFGRQRHFELTFQNGQTGFKVS